MTATTPKRPRPVCPLAAFMMLALLHAAHAQELCPVALEPVPNDDCDASSGSPQPVTADQSGCVKIPGDVSISHDGKFIAYSYWGGIYIRSTADGETWGPLCERRGRLPVWSTTRNELYFLSIDDHQAFKLIRVRAEGNHPATELPCPGRDLERLALSPDASRILLELNGGPEDRPNCEAAEPPKGPVVIDGINYKVDGSGYVASTGGHRVYFLKLADGVFEPLIPPDEARSGTLPDDTDAAWSPDGKQVVFIRSHPESLEYRSELWLAPSTGRQGGGAARLLSTPAERSEPAWSGDGKWIAYRWRDGRFGPYAVAHLAAYSVDRKTEKVLTRSIGTEVISFRFSPDSRLIYFIYAQEGGQHLARVRLSDGLVEPLVTGEHLITSFDIAQDGRIALIMSGINDSAQVYLMNPGEKPRRLTDYNHAFFASRRIAPKQKLFVESDGRKLFEMFVTTPVDFDRSRKYPAVLNLHGGPVSDMHKYGYDFFPQLLAANGYVVIEPNPPGSLGQSQAVMNRIYRNWGCTAYPDAALAVDRLIARGWIDPSKVAVTGISYGGYMTNCLIGRLPQKFRAAASAAGHSAVAANFGYDTWIKWYKWELGMPWRNGALYQEMSPLSRADRIITPTLFLGGTADWNVPLLNEELFYHALKLRGVKTELVVYPGVSHRNWSNQKGDWGQKILDWFKPNLE